MIHDVLNEGVMPANEDRLRLLLIDIGLVRPLANIIGHQPHQPAAGGGPWRQLVTIILGGMGACIYVVAKIKSSLPEWPCSRQFFESLLQIPTW